MHGVSENCLWNFSQVNIYFSDFLFLISTTNKHIMPEKLGNLIFMRIVRLYEYIYLILFEFCEKGLIMMKHFYISLLKDISFTYAFYVLNHEKITKTM